MNNLEKTMVDALRDLRENYGVIGVKAEFEAEGTRMEEALRLKEVVTRAGLELTIKVGGCEALRDMYDARSIGVARVVSPMAESAYAVKKFIAASKLAFPEDEWKTIELAINIETLNAFAQLDDILASPAAKSLYAIVIGRVDMCGSMGLTRDDINTEPVLEKAFAILTKAKACGLRVGVGGGVSADSFDFFRAMPGLDYYETRKVMFRTPAELGAKAREGILKAVGFELMWLRNKHNYYLAIEREDSGRLAMLEKRYSKMIEEVGGHYR